MYFVHEACVPHVTIVARSRMIQVNHHFAPDGPTAAAMGLKAGCDTDCGGVYGGNAITAVNRSILRHALHGTVNLLRLQLKTYALTSMFTARECEISLAKWQALHKPQWQALQSDNETTLGRR